MRSQFPDRVCVVPDCETKRSLDHIKRRPALALTFDHRQLRLRITQCFGPCLIVQWHACIVDGQTVARKELVVSGCPRPRQVKLRKSIPICEQTCQQQQRYLAVHGVGSHFEPSLSFLNCELTMNGVCRYCGSSTTVVTSRSRPPSGSAAASKYSVTTAFSLYGTPFLRRYPARIFVVTTFKLPLIGIGAPRAGTGR